MSWRLARKSKYQTCKALLLGVDCECREPREEDDDGDEVDDDEELARLLIQTLTATSSARV
jgi:hypothetical protein